MRGQQPNKAKPRTHTIEAMSGELATHVARTTSQAQDDAGEKGLMTHLDTIGYGAE